METSTEVLVDVFTYVHPRLCLSKDVQFTCMWRKRFSQSLPTEELWAGWIPLKGVKLAEQTDPLK